MEPQAQQVLLEPQVQMEPKVNKVQLEPQVLEGLEALKAKVTQVILTQVKLVLVKLEEEQQILLLAIQLKLVKKLVLHQQLKLVNQLVNYQLK